MSITLPSFPFHTLSYFIVFSFSTILLLFAFLSSSAHQLCKPEERTALLQFKRHFDIKPDEDCYPRTHSWKDDDEDCCAWDGVRCDNTTGHIIELDLFQSCLYGNLTSLKVLVLRDNNFRGTMKGMLPRFFTNLHIMDMSHNDLTGNLPSEYFKKWDAMANVDEKATGGRYMNISGRYYSVTIVNKGQSLPYEKILATLKVIDFSRNRFYGNIPLSLGRVKGVHVLNLSGNSLTGTIPISLGNLMSLESLDLSNNNLSGKMPSEISNLNFLEFLNVSQNNLSGVIPKGEQLNTFSNASYEANPNLCGFPLSKLCTIPSSPKVAEKKNHHYKFEVDGFGWEIVLIGYTCGMMLGVAIGCCILRNKDEWIMGIFRLKTHQSPKRSNKK